MVIHDYRQDNPYIRSTWLLIFKMPLKFLNISWVSGHISKRETDTTWTTKQAMGSIDSDIFLLNKKHTGEIVDCHTKFPIVKLMDGLTHKIISAEYGLLRKKCWCCTTFVSESFQELCSHLHIHQTVSSSDRHQSNGQAEVCIKLVK